MTIWFEEHGPADGAPVVLLHGGMCTASTWAMQVPALVAAGNRVLAPERTGHGHTPDIEGPITYEHMRDETVAFLEEVVAGPADLVGWSDGGDVAMLVALARPDLVRKLVLIGSNFHHDGTEPAFLDGMGEDPTDDGLFTLRTPYEETSPDGPDHWPVVYRKLVAMWRSGPTLTTDDLARIQAPTLVLVGDDDAVRWEHTLELFQSIPGAQLAVVPGTSHLVPVEKPDDVNRLILDFLADGTPVRFLPLRTAT